jgi:putative hydrolase of the HAD superfamily
MGVIFKEGDDVSNILIPFLKSKSSHIDEAIVKALYYKASLGNISSFEFWTNFNLANNYPEIEKEYIDGNFELNPDFKEIAEILKKKYFLAVLSNDVAEWSNCLRKRFGLNFLFKITIISGDIGLRKPDIRIFKVLLERIKSDPKECVFIDDKLVNVRSASDLGLKTILFVNKNNKKHNLKWEIVINSFKELPSILEQI